MSFLEANFSPIGGQARAGSSPSSWSYQSDTDDTADMIAADYFNEIAAQLKAGDFIYAVATDANSILPVLSVTLSPSGNVVVIDPDLFSTNPNFLQGTVDPVGNVTGSPGNLYLRTDDGDSSFYVHIGTSSNNTDWVSMRENSTILFSALSIATSTTPNFLAPGAQNRAAVTSAVDVQIPIHRSGILKNLRVRHNSTAGNGNEIIYEVLVNDATTGLFVGLPSTAPTGENEAVIVPVVDNDRVVLRASKALAIGTSPTNIYATLGFF